MNIIVCIKQVPASNKVEVDPDTGVILRDGAESKMNPYDLYALESAFKLREEQGGRVTVITMGPPQAKAVIKEAYSMGADHGVLLTDRRFGGADVLATSYALAQGIKQIGDYDLIICGKQTTDGDTAQVGPEIAERLNIPSVSYVSEILKADEKYVQVEMDMPDDIEISKIEYPCLLSVEKDILMPRLPSYVLKKDTMEREIDVLTLDDMEDTDEKHYGLNGSPTQVEKIFPPERNLEQEIWTEDEEKLTDKLFNKLEELKFI